MLQPGVDLTAHLSNKASFIKEKLGLELLQPHVIVISTVGSDVASMPAYAVLGPKLFYRVDSIPQAVDIVLKAAFVFDVEYPPASRSCWTFIQKAVYGLNSSTDIITNRLQELLSVVQRV